MSESPTPARIEPQTSSGNSNQLSDKSTLLDRLKKLILIAGALDARISILEEASIR